MENMAQNFMAEIAAFLQKTGMSVTAFGKLSVNDPAFFPRLKSGRSPTLRIIARVQEFMRRYEPQ